MKAKKKRRASRLRHGSQLSGGVLDSFTAQDLEFWTRRSIELQAYCDRVYFDLERQRAARYDELCSALRAVPPVDVSVDRWVRVTDWRWNLTPLSPAGSLRVIGGRFNIGSELDRARGQAFPGLYLAQDIETAYREHFGAPINSQVGKLPLQELALRRESSFTTFSLRGHLEQIFDLRERSTLNKFVKIISRFDVTPDTKRFAASAKIPPRKLITTSSEMWKRLLVSPSEWRREPQMFGIPAAGQIFGRFVRDAGFEGILYPSQRGGNSCLAVYPENFQATDSTVQVVGEVPPGATCTVLDKNNQCLGT